jgi:hypothetical protein
MVLADSDAAVTIHVYTDAALTVPHSTPTFTVNASGGAAPKLSKYCDDRGTNPLFGASTPVADSGGQTHLAWVGHTTITGLSANTRYHITLTQGALTEGATPGDGISFCSAPAAGTDFRIWSLTCDRIDSNVLPQGDGDAWGMTLGAPHPNIYAYIKQWQEANPDDLAYFAWVDDFGYADAVQVSDTYRQSIGMSQSWPLQYNYGMCYYVMLGMGHDLTDPTIRQGREVSRAWCLRNHCFAVFMWGDHEFTNNFGMQTGPADLPETWDAGSGAWNAAFGPLRISASNRDAGAIHQAITLGDVTIVAADGITNKAGGFVDTSSLVEPFLGTDQIDDILDALDTAAPFKLFCKADGDKNLKDDPAAVYTDYFHQQPMKDRAPTEWARLHTRVLTGADPLSIMANSATNGSAGVLVTLLGDSHRAWAGHYRGGSYSGHHAEDWAAYSVGQINHHPKPLNDEVADTCQPGVTYNGTETYYFEDSGWYEVDGYTDPEAGGLSKYTLKPYQSCVSVDIRGSVPVKEMVINLWDYRGICVWNGIYRVGSNEQVNKPRFKMQGRVT